MKSDNYDVEIHKHNFAAWAASRAASVSTCRFSVQEGKALLETCGFKPQFSIPDALPDAASVDKRHRQWRKRAIKCARHVFEGKSGSALTHGVAAKLINVYLKARFVCAGYHSHERVRSLHPPIDSQLLQRLANTLAASDVRTVRSLRWSKLSSDQYEELIKLIRKRCGSAPLWKIEIHWPGYR